MATSPNPFRYPSLLAIWAPPLLWGLAILSLSGSLGSGANTMGLLKWLLSGISSLSHHEIEVMHWYLRKLGHLAAYGVLYLLWFRALRRQAPGRSGLALKLALLLSLLVALMNEGLQILFPERIASLTDVALDMTGMALAALICPGLFKPRAPGQGGDARP